MRAIIALVCALNETFAAEQAAGPLTEKGSTRPYQLLMVGGDDLLLLCRAESALPFVKHYASKLSALRLHDGKPLGVGAGIVICQPTCSYVSLGRCERRR